MPRLNLPRRASPPQPLPSPARAAALPGHHDPCTLGAPRTPARPGWRGVAGLLLGLTTLSAVPAQAQWVVIETVDCPAAANTICTVAVGGTAKGRIIGIDGSDTWGVTLQAGKTYRIDVKGLDTGDGTLPDPWLSLFDTGDNYLTDNIGGGTGRNSRITYTVPPGDGGIFGVSIESDRARDGTYTLTVVDTANTAPMGRPTISGTAQVGKVLRAVTTTITDADGLTSPNFIYQWVRVDGETETDIASAASSTYTPVAADVGKRITVRVCFTDDGRSAEGPLTSEATEVVVAPAFSVADASAEEGDALTFVVTLSPAASETVTVTYATSVESGNTATSDDDFTAASATLTFAANETRKTIRVITLEDTVFEEDETLTLTLSNVQSTGLVLIADETATGTIDADIFDEREDCQDGASFVTRCAMDHADLSSGSIASATDLDAWSVILDPGKTYEIDVRGAGDPGGDNPGTLADPSVVLIEWDYDEKTGAFTRDQRASNDNVSPTNKNARLTYTHHPADQLQRVFYVVIAGVSGGTGTYTVIVRDVTPADRETNNCAANHNTACNLAVGGTVTGSLSTAQDTDTWRVPLKSDKTYQVDVRGADSNGGTLPDPTLQLMSYDSNTTGLVQVAAADNGGTGEAARLTHAVLPGQGGNYYITIGGNGSTGSYTLTVIEVTSAPQREESPLTAEFRNMPAEHDGTSFTFAFHFSESPRRLSYKTLRASFFDVTNGTVRKAKRLARGDNSGWRITVEPDGLDEVQISFLPSLPSDDCADAATVCTADGRRLSTGAATFVSGPASFSVADATVQEAAGATLDFVITLSRARHEAATVDYTTSDGEAKASEDYAAAAGTLTFARGVTEQTVSVLVLDDGHDEGEETLTLTLSRASGAVIVDGEATGTIENTDPLPRALLARFGRATALHVMEQVEERLEASRAPGLRGRFAGRELRRGMERDMGRNFLSRLQSTAVQGARDTTGVHTDLGGAELLRTGLGGGDVLTGSGFVFNRETGQGASVSLWSRGMESRFSGREGELSLDGGVRTTMFGADYAKGPLMAGLMLSHRRGLGGYQGADVGQVASSVTGLHPWVGYQLTERVTLWGVTGYGRGSLSLTPGEALSLPTSLAAPVALKGGLSMSMLAGGVRGNLVDAGIGGFGLAFKADALWVGTGSEAVDGPAGRLAATEAVVTRVRTALEASRGYVFGHGIALRPSFEVGLRRDGGDAETGVGADVAASLIASDPWTGLSVDVRVRTLLVHQDEGFRERGVSVSFSYDPTPSTPLGFKARVAPSWGGQAMSGADALWGRDTMKGLGAAGPGSGDRIDAELGYALPVGSRLVGTPRFGVTTSEYGRDYRLGYGLAVVQGGAMSFQFGLDAQRRESLGRGDADHSLVGRLTVGW